MVITFNLKIIPKKDNVKTHKVNSLTFLLYYNYSHINDNFYMKKEKMFPRCYLTFESKLPPPK